MEYLANFFQSSDPPFSISEARGWLRPIGEVAYVLTIGQLVVPVEIKAGTTGTPKSLHQFLKEKQRHYKFMKTC